MSFHQPRVFLALTRASEENRRPDSVDHRPGRIHMVLIHTPIFMYIYGLPFEKILDPPLSKALGVDKIRLIITQEPQIRRQRERDEAGFKGTRNNVSPGEDEKT